MRILPTAFVLALAFLFSACGGSKHQAAAKETVTLMEQIGTALESAKDEATAKAAASKLGPIITRITELQKETQGLEKPTGAAEEALKTEFAARMQAAVTKMTTQMGRVMMDPKLSAILQPVMEKMSK